MVIPVIGSMAVKGVFRAGGLLTGLGNTIGKLKETQMNSKSTSTEMKRMTGQSHLLAKALGLIGVTGFTALLMQTPQLAGALAKIKTEMMLIAYSVGKHLKPALDDVAGILHDIRTGDWTGVKQGVINLTSSLLDLIGKAATFVLEPILGEEATETVKTDFKNWLRDLKTTLDEEGPSFNFMSKLFITPLKWLWNHCGGILSTIKDIMDSISGKLFPGFREGSPLDKFTKKLYDLDRWVGQSVYDVTGIDLPGGQEINVGGGGGGSSNVTVDFSGANINLASGIEIEDFANVISMRIAEKQRGVTY